MKRNNEWKAFVRYREPIERALGCIASERLTIPDRKGFSADRDYAILLNRNEIVRLAAPYPLYFYAMQRFQVVYDDAPVVEGPFRVHTQEYLYSFHDEEERELIAFHWTPNAAGSSQKSFGHFHIKSPMLAERTPIKPGEFSKVHIPTERLSIESIVRFAIDELGATPRIPHWREVLEEGEQSFRLWKRPEH